MFPCMIKLDHNQVSLLDCTLRDGGYCSNWDFDDNLIDEYFETLNQLPIDYIEVGYRSIEKEEYAGAYYYLPDYLLKSIRDKTNKKLAIILNEKEVRIEDLGKLLGPCQGIVDMVRLAVAPDNYNKSLALASKVKELGFTVSINLMYASRWETDFILDKNLKSLNAVCDYFYVVDSFGGLYPEQVSIIFKKLKQYIDIPLGFHGHNNLELALINSLAAIKSGAKIIDSTIAGMGRGAGNLKTELWLSVLHEKYKIAVDFDSLNVLINSFLLLKEKYSWGTSLPYMVSGAYSLPQNTVMSQVKKRYYSLNAIIDEVCHTNNKNPDGIEFPNFENFNNVEKVLLVGGGKSVQNFSNGLIELLEKNPDICIIYASSKNVPILNKLPNHQIHCLSGMEGKRLVNLCKFLETKNRNFILPPKTISINNHVPHEYRDYTFQLESIEVVNKFKSSSTAIAVEIIDQLGAKEIFLTGYDGYDEPITRDQLELFDENQFIFNYLKANKFKLSSLTPSLYKLPIKSIFSII